MQSYLGLLIKLSLKSDQSLIGTVQAIDLPTQSLTLSNVVIDGKNYDKMTIGGSDIQDLKIMPKETIKKESIKKAPIVQKESVSSSTHHPHMLTAEQLESELFSQSSYSQKPEKFSETPSSKEPLAKPSKQKTMISKISTPNSARFASSQLSITSAQWTHVIRYATMKFGPNSVQMVENGARSLLSYLLDNTPNLPRHVVIFAGPHRVGAIGMAFARLLSNRGVSVVVMSLLSGSEEDDKYLTFQQELAQRHGVVMEKNCSNLRARPDLIIDSMSESDFTPPLLLVESIIEWVKIQLDKPESLTCSPSQCFSLSISSRIDSFVFPSTTVFALGLPLSMPVPQVILDIGLSPLLLLKCLQIPLSQTQSLFLSKSYQ